MSIVTIIRRANARIIGLIQVLFGDTCPDCHREDWNDLSYHGYSYKYDHCRWCGYCTYVQRYEKRRGHHA